MIPDVDSVRTLVPNELHVAVSSGASVHCLLMLVGESHV